MRKTVCLMMFLVPLTAFTQSVPFLWGHGWPAGGTGLAMGGALTGVADDYNATLYNPAGLGQMTKRQFAVDFSRVGVENDAVYLDNPGTDTGSAGRLNSVGLIMPVPTVRGSLVFGFSYHRVRDLEQSLNVSQLVDFGIDDYRATWNQVLFEEGAMSMTSFSGAVEVAPDLFAGGSIHFRGGSDDYTWRYAERDPYYGGELLADSISAEYVRSRFSGFQATFGVLYHPDGPARFGVAVESPVTLKVTEDWDYKESFAGPYGAPEEEVYSESGRYEYKVSMPWVFRAGAALELGPVLVSADIRMNNYNQIRYQTDPPSGGSKSAINWDIKQNFRNVMDYSGGARLRIPGTPLSLMGGYAVRNAPYEDAADAENRTILSGGLGIDFMRGSRFLISYGRTEWKREIMDPYNWDPFTGTDLLIDQTIRMDKWVLALLFNL